MAIVSLVAGWHGCRLSLRDFDQSGRLTRIYIYARVANLLTDEARWDAHAGVYLVTHLQDGQSRTVADLQGACLAAWQWEQQRRSRTTAARNPRLH